MSAQEKRTKTEELINRIRTGDGRREALDELCRLVWEDIAAACRMACRAYPRLHPDDLFQEVWKWLLEKGLYSFRTELGDLPGFVWGFARRKASGMTGILSFKDVPLCLMGDRPDGCAGEPGNQAAAREAWDTVLAMLEQEPEPARTVNTLHFQGVTTKEIARRLGLKYQTANSHLFRFRRRVREAISWDLEE